MNQRRPIREQELALIHHMLQHVQLNPADYPIDELVEEYEGGKMGSISLGGNPEAYAGDVVQVNYIDSDQTPVVITLTKDEHNRLLDLDFWKVDFSKLLEYPTPDKVVFQ